LLAAFRKVEILAKVPGFLVEHVVRVWFPTLVGRLTIIERAIAAAVYVDAASRARIAPANAIFGADFLLAVITGFHKLVLC
jgi:hypothetical protein